MTVKQAIKLLDMLIKSDRNIVDRLLDSKKPWNTEFDNIRRLAKSFADLAEQDMQILTEIKNELVVKCSHPKKLRDIDPNGKPYCTACNQDL